MSPSKLLVVDDEKSILSAIRRLLRNESFETHVTESPEEALERVAAEPYAAVVSDYRMPSMTGTDLLEKVRGISPETVRIILTGHAETKAVMDAINRGAVYRFLTKPWNDEELCLTLREAVARHELLAENDRLQKLTAKQNAELKDLNQNLEKKVVERTREISELNQQIHRTFIGSIRMLAGLAEMHGPLIGSHSRRTARLCTEVAKHMRLPEREQFHIVVAATLHDIGKIGIPADILEKPEYALTPKERRVIEGHAVRGEAMAQMLPNLGDVPRMIRHHHEHVDGTGYPEGLRGEQIPLGSRIIAAVDAYDHRLNDRRTYGSTTPAKALDLIRKLSGQILDPKAATALIACVAASQHADSEEFEVDVQPEDLCEGMVVSREVRSLRGVLLLPKDTVLLRKHFPRLRSRDSTDPVVDPIYIYRRCDEQPGSQVAPDGSSTRPATPEEVR